jgi:antitoxin MazE
MRSGARGWRRRSGERRITGKCGGDAIAPALLFIDNIDTRRSNVRIVVKKRGNSASVRVPAAVIEAAHLDKGALVDACREDGRIVAEAIGTKIHDLEYLLSGITAKNIHAEEDSGAPMGEEAL